jgi:hypothetical protein
MEGQAGIFIGMIYRAAGLIRQYWTGDRTGAGIGACEGRKDLNMGQSRLCRDGAMGNVIDRCCWIEEH